MPIYVYACECGKVHEVWKRGYNPKDYIMCGCGKMAWRQITNPGYIRLKWKPSHRQTALTRPNNKR